MNEGSDDGASINLSLLEIASIGVPAAIFPRRGILLVSILFIFTFSFSFKSLIFLFMLMTLAK